MKKKVIETALETPAYTPDLKQSAENWQRMLWKQYGSFVQKTEITRDDEAIIIPLLQDCHTTPEHFNHDREVYREYEKRQHLLSKIPELEIDIMKYKNDLDELFAERQRIQDKINVWMQQLNATTGKLGKYKNGYNQNELAVAEHPTAFGLMPTPEPEISLADRVNQQKGWQLVVDAAKNSIRQILAQTPK